MASQEDVEEINTYLQQHAQKQAEKGVEQKNFLTGLQRALFGETHADYPSPPSRAAPTPSPSPQSLHAPTPVPVTPPAPIVNPIPAAPVSTPIVAEKNNFSTAVAPSTASPTPVRAPSGGVPSTSSPSNSGRMPYKFSEETDTPALSPPPARFNPYPNPYHKAVPSPPTFSDSTAPPWVMRTLPAESRDTRKENSGDIAPVVADSASKSTPVPAAVPLKKEIQSFTSPAAPTLSPVKDPRSTRAKMMELVHETNSKEGNDSPHRMPWHADTSGEVTPNELVGLASTSPPVRTPASPDAAAASSKRSAIPSLPSAGLNSQEHDYLLRKEQEYDRAHAGIGNPAGSSSPASTHPIQNTENSSMDEKKVILGRLKELMAQHQNTTPQN